jgi:hypothetical protein
MKQLLGNREAEGVGGDGRGDDDSWDVLWVL